MKASRLFVSAGVGPWVRFVYFSRFVNKYLRDHRDLRILDAGFGRGEYITWLAGRLPDASLVGYDISAGNTYTDNFELAKGKIRTENVTLFVKDLKSMDDESLFDAIYSIDVLEHIPGNETVLHNIYKALKDEGLFYLAMPYDKERPIVLPTRYFEQFRAWADEEHIGEMRSLPETESLLRSIGFNLLESRYTFGFFARLAWELEQVLKSFPGSRHLSRLGRPILNALATLEFVSKSPDDGNILIVCQKPQEPRTPVSSLLHAGEG